MAVDLFCGLGGWAEGFLSEGWDVVGFDIERRPYPGDLVLQDVTTLHGRQFKDAAVIVASPPCQAYSYRAMPWKRAKALPPPDNTLFDACFRIQREASEAAGHHIPMVVENVRGAQPWVGKARAHYGSYYLWGDVDSLGNKIVAGGLRPENVLHVPGRVRKVPGFNFHQHENGGKGGSFQTAAVAATSGKGQNPDGRKLKDADGYERNHPNAFGWKSPRTSSGATQARKHASAVIAKIPFPLAVHIARVFKPHPEDVARREAAQ